MHLPKWMLAEFANGEAAARGLMTVIVSYNGALQPLSELHAQLMLVLLDSPLKTYPPWL